MLNECLRCGFNCSRKDSFKRHLFGTPNRPRKKPCKAKYLDVQPDEMFNNYDQLYEEYKDIRSSQENENKLWKCSTCGMETQYHSNYIRHVNKNICASQNETLLETIKTMQETINHLISNNNSGINAGTINLDSSTVTGDINQSNQQQNFINNINNYGKENIEHLSFERMVELGKCPPEAVPKLVEEIHYKNPENRNINYPNVRDSKRGEKFENGRWNQTSLPSLVEDLFVNKHNIFEDFIKKCKNELPIEWVYKMSKMLEEVDDNLIARKEQKRKIKDVMLNNRHLIKK